MEATYLQHKGLFYYEKNTAKGGAAKEHYHDFFELYLLESGSCHYFIDERAFDVAPGDLILIPPGTIHKTTYLPQRHSRALIYCSADYIPPLLGDLPQRLPLYRNTALQASIQAIFDRIGAEFRSATASDADPIAAEMLQELTHILFYILLRHRDGCIDVQCNNPLITAVIRELKLHLGDELRLSEIADRHGISAEHLSRLFKKETGLGLWEYLTTLRMRRAADMLCKHPGRSVARIAGDCGFNDSNYFSKRFRDSFGCSPRRYRKQHTTM